ncbi:MAG: choice-of-anchor D domain-containing protein, partial [Myxococcales bacterium]
MQTEVQMRAGAAGARMRWGPPGRAFGPGFALLALFALGCSEPVQPVVTEPKPPGLEAEPRWLTFKCVKPGCDETLDVTVRQVGPRKLAIKRVVLSEPGRAEFSIESELEAPAIVNEQFKVSVRYRPIGGPVKGDVKLLVTYTDASPEEDGNRIPPGEVSVPLLRRLVGEPVLVASPERLVFGAVSPGESKSLPLTVSNAGSGNLSLAISAVVSDEPTIQAQALPSLGLAPGMSSEVQIGYAPQGAAYSEAKLLVRAAGDMVPPVEVIAVGTSLPDPTVAALPAEGLDFGRVEKGTQKRAGIEVVNRGGAPLEIESVRVLGNPNLAVTLPNEATSLTLAPLESVEVMVWLSSETAGDIDAYVELTTNDPSARQFRVPVVGMVTEPHAVAPESIEFGKVPKGWVLTKPITVQNGGWGELEVNGLTLVLGSSDLFTLRSLPALPLSLERDQKLGL